ncbi:MAG TPA: hypothetical protein VJY62_00810 [Bacteroidia bacterium]|nr:hypothetical protein [Bacteroidia bacterium]
MKRNSFIVRLTTRQVVQHLLGLREIDTINWQNPAGEFLPAGWWVTKRANSSF